MSTLVASANKWGEAATSRASPDDPREAFGVGTEIGGAATTTSLSRGGGGRGPASGTGNDLYVESVGIEVAAESESCGFVESVGIIPGLAESESCGIVESVGVNLALAGGVGVVESVSIFPVRAESESPEVPVDVDVGANEVESVGEAMQGASEELSETVADADRQAMRSVIDEARGGEVALTACIEFGHELI